MVVQQILIEFLKETFLQVEHIFLIAVDVVFQAEMMDREAMALCGQYQIDVDVNSITFWHHHLFSQEHVYASRITRLYEEYVSRMKKKTVEFLTGKVSHSLCMT